MERLAPNTFSRLFVQVFHPLHPCYFCLIKWHTEGGSAVLFLSFPLCALSVLPL